MNEMQLNEIEGVSQLFIFFLFLCLIFSFLNIPLELRKEQNCSPLFTKKLRGHLGLSRVNIILLFNYFKTLEEHID